MRSLTARPVRIIAAGLVLAVAGCAPVPIGITYQPAVEASDGAVDEAARGELLAALDKLEADPVSVEASMGDLVTITASSDPAAGAVQASMSIVDAGERLDMEMIMIGTDLWMSMGDLHEAVGVDTRWMYADLSGLADMAQLLGVDPNLLLGNSFLFEEGMETVTKVDGHTFQGEIDPVTAYSSILGEPPPDVADMDLALGFTAVLDDNGRLTQLTLTFPDAPPGTPDTMEARYFDHGVPADISPPPAEEVSPMPEELRALLGADG